MTVRSSVVLGRYLSIVQLIFSCSLLACHARPCHAQGDSVIVFGPSRFVGDGSGAWLYDETSFTTTDTLARRYLVEVVNSPTGITGVLVTINGRQYVGSSECTGGIARVVRIVDNVTNQNTISVAVKGTASSYCDVRVVHVADSSHCVMGYRTYVRPSVVAAQYDSFVVGHYHSAPYVLRAINGNGSGLNRVTNISIKLNGATVMSSGDFGSGRATATQEITLTDSLNRIEILNQSATGTFIELQVRAEGPSPLNYLPPVDSGSWQVLVAHALDMPAVQAVMDIYAGRGYERRADRDTATMVADTSFAAIWFQKPDSSVIAAITVITKPIAGTEITSVFGVGYTMIDSVMTPIASGPDGPVRGAIVFASENQLDNYHADLGDPSIERVSSFTECFYNACVNFCFVALPLPDMFHVIVCCVLSWIFCSLSEFFE